MGSHSSGARGANRAAKARVRVGAASRSARPLPAAARLPSAIPARTRSASRRVARRDEPRGSTDRRLSTDRGVTISKAGSRHRRTHWRRANVPLHASTARPVQLLLYSVEARFPKSLAVRSRPSRRAGSTGASRRHPARARAPRRRAPAVDQAKLEPLDEVGQALEARALARLEMPDLPAFTGTWGTPASEEIRGVASLHKPPTAEGGKMVEPCHLHRAYTAVGRAGRRRGRSREGGA